MCSTEEIKPTPVFYEAGSLRIQRELDTHMNNMTTAVEEGGRWKGVTLALRPTGYRRLPLAPRCLPVEPATCTHGTYDDSRPTTASCFPSTCKHVALSFSPSPTTYWAKEGHAWLPRACSERACRRHIFFMK